MLTPRPGSEADVSALVSDVAALVTLKGGLSVPLEAFELALSLEQRGATFRPDGAELIVDTDDGVLTEADRVAITRWKGHLIAIAAYRVSDAELPQ
jgi:hypothetical protein